MHTHSARILFWDQDVGLVQMAHLTLPGFNAVSSIGGFALENLHEIVWSDEAFERLVISEKQKTLIHALIRQHSTQATQFDDLIVGKGKGLIGLLCGNPGCGKTLTAEAAAETTRRPLYVVSAGELGTRPEEVDERLARILELSHLWNAVLLIDEAEVFLQKRSTTDIARNALVSIFLRQLEYYQGIMILTTNMAAQCDPAFESTSLVFFSTLVEPDRYDRSYSLLYKVP